MKKFLFILIVLVLLVAALGGGQDPKKSVVGKRNVPVAPSPDQGAGTCATEAPGPNKDIFTTAGKRIKIVKGDLYVCKDDGTWGFVESLVREDVKDIAIRRTGDTCEVSNAHTGESVVYTSTFKSGFEATSLLELFGPQGWSVTTLLSPKADSVPKYVELNKKLMAGGEFLDNRIDLERNNVREGNTALRFYTVKPAADMITSKALLEKNTLCFGKGDDLWFSGWFYVEQGMPSTLVDFESRLWDLGPGIRLFLRDGKYASLELKFGTKPQYNQRTTVFPAGKWVHIKIHLGLSNREDGVIEMWQDGKQIISTKGQTLPTHDLFYNSLEVGITATNRETVLLVDDVSISNRPL